MRLSSLLSLAFLALPVQSFLVPLSRGSALSSAVRATTACPQWRARSGVVVRAAGEEEAEEDEATPPGKMKVSEMKAELDLRGVRYEGIFERSELEKLLKEAREDGVARPELLETFNAQREQQKKTTQKKIEDFDWEVAKANDGTLPGGLKKEAVEQLTANEELMGMLQDPNLQELMKATMEKDAAKMGQLMQNPDVMKLIQRFNELAQEAGIDPSALRGM